MRKLEPIELKFIGTDGSMGLRNGQIYNVFVYSDLGSIIVDWGTDRCPYSSSYAFASNWIKVA